MMAVGLKNKFGRKCLYIKAVGKLRDAHGTKPCSPLHWMNGLLLFCFLVVSELLYALVRTASLLLVVPLNLLSSVSVHPICLSTLAVRSPSTVFSSAFCLFAPVGIPKRISFKSCPLTWKNYYNSQV